MHTKNSEENDQELQTSNNDEIQYCKSPINIKYTEHFEEIRISWINISKYVAVSWISVIWSVCALVQVLTRPDIYLGILTCIITGIVYVFLSIKGIMVICKHSFRFIDPHHNHYFLRNTLLYILKAMMILFMLWDMMYPSSKLAFVINITFLPIFGTFTFWNYIIIKNRYRRCHF